MSHTRSRPSGCCRTWSTVPITETAFCVRSSGAGAMEKAIGASTRTTVAPMFRASEAYLRKSPAASWRSALAYSEVHACMTARASATPFPPWNAAAALWTALPVSPATPPSSATGSMWRLAIRQLHTRRACIPLGCSGYSSVAYSVRSGIEPLHVDGLGQRYRPRVLRRLADTDLVGGAGPARQQRSGRHGQERRVGVEVAVDGALHAVGG